MKKYIKTHLKWWILLGFCLGLILVFGIKFVGASTLVDETINASNTFSKYSLSHYQLDFFVDKSWDWLPWNWGEGIGKTVMYGVYFITNIIWGFNLLIANLTGYLVGQAFSLDFISDSANYIGQNIQTITGVSEWGVSNNGIFVSLLFLLVVILGCYIAYVALFKRQTTKALGAILNFLIVGVLSVSFFAFAPTYINSLNDFSKELSTTVLDLGSNIILPNSENSEQNNKQNSVDLIRDSLFSLQVKQPWLILQFGTTDIEEIGVERVENLESTNPDTNHGKDREDLVKKEIEEEENYNLSLPRVAKRFGYTLLIIILNLIISLFIIYICALLIFAQILFILLAMVLPLCFIIALIPTQNSTLKKALFKFVNLVITRTGLVLIATLTFCVSTMLFGMTSEVPFIFVMIIQAILFVGVGYKIFEILGLMGLKNRELQRGLVAGRKMPRNMNREFKKVKNFFNKGISTKENRSFKQESYSNEERKYKHNEERNVALKHHQGQQSTKEIDSNKPNQSTHYSEKPQKPIQNNKTNDKRADRTKENTRIKKSNLTPHNRSTYDRDVLIRDFYNSPSKKEVTLPKRKEH